MFHGEGLRQGEWSWGLGIWRKVLASQGLHIRRQSWFWREWGGGTTLARTTHTWLPVVPWGGQSPSLHPAQMVGQEPRGDRSSHEPQPTPGDIATSFISFPLLFLFSSFSLRLPLFH